ncbi:hypothetical protein GCM10023329_29470 [Streptomyces sanyensis]|uniref:Uncharacterized protein n=1 Tax=Streptomyces sanyensis TaxID=568869 RepID=A0ABP9ADC0_9ACTN
MRRGWQGPGVDGILTRAGPDPDAGGPGRAATAAPWAGAGRDRRERGCAEPRADGRGRGRALPGAAHPPPRAVSGPR